MPPSTPSSAFTMWLKDFVATAKQPDQIDAFVTTVDDAIIVAIPEIAGDPALIEELHASTRAHWIAFLGILADDHRLELPREAIDLSLSIARRHHEISVLLKVYRIANKAVFDVLAARTGADELPAGLGRDEVLISVWLRAEQWIDDSVEALIDSFTAERTALLEGDRALRIEAVEALLAGSPPTSQIERVLGHPLTLWQTAFVLSGSAGEGGSVPLQEVAERGCRTLGLPRPFTTLRGSRELWGWVATPVEPTFDLEELVGTVADAGVRVAMGRPVHGPSGFRVSHLQAVAARDAGRGSTERRHDYREIELVSLLGDGELAREMVLRVAQPLLGSRKADQVLRDTVLAWLRCGRTAEAAGVALFIHPNTVRYRLARAQELLGHSIGEDATALELALEWVRVHGTQALDLPD